MIPFMNEALLDFTRQENAAIMRAALNEVTAQLGRVYPLQINGVSKVTDRVLDSINPCQHRQVIGRIAQGSSQDAEEALAAAWQAFESWKLVKPAVRANYLFKIAAIMRRKKATLSAWLVLEVGKNWVEADADVAEAIDFCELYAREALRLANGGSVLSSQSEHNQLVYLPLGVGIIISPWNFPLAILMGMAAAAIVTGNTVIIKPANTAGVIAAKAYEIMQEADLPPGVVNYLPGSGAQVGEYMVQHPKTRFINFTGSKAVGLRINELAAQTRPGQLWIKRVSAEMGGKDCIIVDETADLDAAAEGIVRSAFGFQGQKCSACSRAIVVKDVYEPLLERVSKLTAALTVGPAESNFPVNAVIDGNAFSKISQYLELGNSEGRIVVGGRAEGQDGYYIHPTIIADVAPHATLAKEEIFGPVLSFIQAADFSDALRIGNGTEYGLTGSVYSQRRERLEQAREELFVGNLYLNRGCTGATVGRHPFGGFNMSGTNSKAGGPDYLPLFMQAKSICERL